MDSTADRRRSLNGWAASVRWAEAARALVGLAGLALLVVGAVKFAGRAATAARSRWSSWGRSCWCARSC